ncbi:MAG: helix-turn-helix domain-containing protein [Clostridia bacterium]|nr:helix-turn-helix domain-containing protein [Clostridia bacterium]
MGGVGDKLYHLRMARNLTQEQLGNEVGVTRQTVSLWEANKRQINAEKLKTLSDFFGVDPEYFFVREKGAPEETDNENKELAIVACAEFEQESDEKYKYELIRIKAESEVKSNKRFVKKIILISVIIAVLLIGVVAIVLGTAMEAHKDGFGSASSTTFNFGLESIGWLVFVLASILAVICLAILIRTKRKEKR